MNTACRCAGPDYARRRVDDAIRTGVDLRTGVTVTDLLEGGRLGICTDAGTATLAAHRVAVCTGTRESSRAQRFIAGTRPQGVISTGALQAFVYLEQMIPFRRPVILGTELISFSALLTCRHAGIRPVAMIEPQSRITARAFCRGLPAVMRVPLHLNTRICRILGDRQVEGIEVETGRDGRRVIEADGLICTGQFRPESALMRNGHLAVDPGTGGPVVDQYARASDPAYFCAGNLLRPVETHAWCAQEGDRTAAMIVEDLVRDAPAGAAADTPIVAAHPSIRYVMPQRLSADSGGTTMQHLQIRLADPARGRLVARADGRTVWSKRIDALPERRLLAPLAALLPHRGAKSIEIGLEEAKL